MRPYQSLVAGFGASPFNGLFDIFRGQDAKSAGNTRFHIDKGNSFGNFIADIIIVTCCAADNSTKQMIPSYLPLWAIFFATRGISKAPGTQQP